MGAVVMLPSRSPLRFCALVVCLSLAMLRTAVAQSGDKSAPSPFAPGDMSKPVFNTTAPVYDSVASLDKVGEAVTTALKSRGSADRTEIGHLLGNDQASQFLSWLSAE